MKKCLLALGLLIGVASCSRHNDVGNDCISRYSLSPGTVLLPQSTLDSINTLFTKNNLSEAGLQFTFLSPDTVQSPVYTGVQYQVSANVFLNGLPAFNQSAWFNFDSTGVYMPLNSGPFTGSAPNDTTGHRSLESLRQIFLNNYKLCTTAGGAANSKPSHPTAPYQDTCLAALLGYMQPPGTTWFTKVWMVSAADNHGYPAVFISDSSGQAWPLNLFFP